jgi:lipopolysaccharide/colanic/teichoic acid biosynthesis glycosyltransferase
VSREGAWPYAEIAERLASGFLLIVFGPILLGAALWIFILSSRTPWIAHRRVGRYGTALWVPKLRTMWDRRERLTAWSRVFSIEYIDDEGGPALKGPEDDRVGSRFARFCRRHSLDEIPQLMLVLTGRMSLVGPRPVTPRELALIYGPDADTILMAKPGLSGLWQVSGRNRLTCRERRALDVQSVRNRSWRLYLAILVRTIPEVLSGRNTW